MSIKPSWELFEEWTYCYDERAAIMAHHGGLSREEAEGHVTEEREMFEDTFQIEVDKAVAELNEVWDRSGCTMEDIPNDQQ